jgi:hypothetical protein
VEKGSSNANQTTVRFPPHAGSVSRAANIGPADGDSVPPQKERKPAMETPEHYYELTGEGAVTLMGLLFVVITLAAEQRERDDKWLAGTFLSPTVFHLGVVFMIALLALSPEADRLIPPFGLIGVFGLAYGASISLKVARSGQGWDAWLFHAGVPIICYLGIIAAAWLGMSSTRQAYLILRVVSALLLLVGMRNAWAVAMDVAGRRSN